MRVFLFALLTLTLGCPKEDTPAADTKPQQNKAAETKKAVEAKAQDAEAPNKSAVETAPAAPVDPALLAPAEATEIAPQVFKVKFETSKGDFVVEAHREWAPHGADRFYNLVKIGYFNDLRFFRAIDNFMVQFGIHGSPAVNQKWRMARITDDPVKGSNKRSFVTFAMAGPDTRTTQIFINYKDNTNLDRMNFATFGQVVSGMKVVDSLYKGYGEGAPRGRGPDQGRLQSEGNTYLDANFPKLDKIITATLVKP